MGRKISDVFYLSIIYGGLIMAGLKKPEACKCGSNELKREYHPECWVCIKCENVVVSRGKKPQTGTCTVCGAKKEDGIPFKPGKNLCMEHYNEYMRDWNKENHEEVSKRKKEYYSENRERIRARSNAYWQSSVETFMSELLGRCKKSAVKNMSGKKRKNPMKFDLDKEYLLGLHKQQDGKCAITNAKMEH